MTADVNPQAQAIMDVTANTYFPKEMKNESLAGNGPITSDSLGEYSTDTLKYISPLLVSFTTPANHLGIGNDELSEGSYNNGSTTVKPTVKISIRGFLKLITSPDEGAYQIDIFAAAMPESLSGLFPYIQNYAEKLN